MKWAGTRSFLRTFGEGRLDGLRGVTLSNVLSTTETAADVCALKRVTLAVCEAVEGVARYVPVLLFEEDGAETAKQTACVVWGNVVAVEDASGALAHRGWNVEAGYERGSRDIVAPFSRCAPRELEAALGAVARLSAPGGGAADLHAYVSGDRAVWHVAFSAATTAVPTTTLSTRYLCVEGRLDSVVKVRGFRVDLAGLEATLLSDALTLWVLDAVAVAHDDTVWALLVLKPDGHDAQRSPSKATTEPSSDWRAFDVEIALVPAPLQKALEALFPTLATRPALLALGALPYSATGKRDRISLRAALPAPACPHTRQ